MLTVPFLTDLDSRAQVKGSRDPLGIQPIWTNLGRHVVGNLTTVSRSTRDFATLILGYYFAGRLSEEQQGQSELATFLKWEQLAAYARGYVLGDWEFRGTEKAKKNVGANAKKVVWLSADPSAQILGNQKIYGLWGLYTVPARSSLLLDGMPSRLTPAAMELVEEVYLPTFSSGGLRNGDDVARKLVQPRGKLELDGADKSFVEAVAKIWKKHPKKRERESFRDHLLWGGPTDSTRGAQKFLAALFPPTFQKSDFQFNPATVRSLAKQIRAKGGLGGEVAHRLDRIATCERLIAPAAAFFSFLLDCHDQTPGQVEKLVRGHWGSKIPIDVAASAELKAEFRQILGDEGAAERWINVARALSQGDFADVVQLLVEQNQFVMQARGSAPWVELRSGKLFVRMVDGALRSLPTAADLLTYTRHSYFLSSLWNIGKSLQEDGHA